MVARPKHATEDTVKQENTESVFDGVLGGPRWSSVVSLAIDHFMPSFCFASGRVYALGGLWPFAMESAFR